MGIPLTCYSFCTDVRTRHPAHTGDQPADLRAYHRKTHVFPAGCCHYRLPSILFLAPKKITGESPAMRGVLGACHALEMPFMFGTLHHPMEQRFAGTGPEAERLSEVMMNTWIAFVRTGDPNYEGPDTWPMYDRENRQTMLFGKACGGAVPPVSHTF